jgi:hypothetical protein
MKYMNQAKKFFGGLWAAARSKSAELTATGFTGLAMALAFVPRGIFHPNPFDVDLSGVMSGAEDMFNGLFPAFTPIIGIQLGVGLVLLVIGLIGGVIISLARKR